PAVPDHHLHRVRGHDQRRADAGRGRHPAGAPPRPVRRATRRGARGLRRRRTRRARGRQPRRDRRRAAPGTAAGADPAQASRRACAGGERGRDRAGPGQHLSRLQASEHAVTDLANPRAFRAAREHEWARLEDILNRAERHSVRDLDDEDLRALPVLYRGALSSLSVARETSLDLELVTYLEGLCARAYFFVYGVRTPL